MEYRAIRRSGRVECEIPVQISGLDANGKHFVEETRTILISQCGAKIFLQHRLVEDLQVSIRHLRLKRETQARVAWQRELATGGFHCGIEFPDLPQDFWETEFQADTRDSNIVAHFLLECTRCGTQKVMDVDSMEELGLKNNQPLQRPCPRCQSFVMWKFPGQ